MTEKTSMNLSPVTERRTRLLDELRTGAEQYGLTPADMEFAAELDFEEATAYAGLIAAMEMSHATAQASRWEFDPETGEPKPYNMAEKLCLVHSEISEALEAHRKGLMDDKLKHRPGIEVELADALIRIFDIARRNNLDLAGAMIEKNRFNRQREDHKPENRAKAGGKKY